MFWTGLTVALVAAFLIWSLYQKVRHDREAFSKANLSRSFYDMGILALLLIILVTFCIMMLKSY